MTQELHLGHKLIKAAPMTRKEYNDYRGWDLPQDENHIANEQGYLVEYIDGGRSNHPSHTGYISWSPANVFRTSYRKDGSFTFGDAVELLKRGYRVARSGWNGKGMFLCMVKGEDYQLNTIAENKLVGMRQDPWIGMKTAGDSFVPWLASQSDVLSNDWCIVE